MAIKRMRGPSPPSIANTEARRRSSSMPKWGQLVGDVLLQILNRLSFVDVQRAKTVCSHWNSVAKQLKLYTKFHRIPWLLIPPQDEESNASSDTNTKLFSIEDGQLYSSKYAASKEICCQSFCVGSSHGYMISINCERNKLFVFNPLTEKRTELPAMDTFLGSIIEDMDNGGEYLIKFAPEAASDSRFYRGWTCSRQLREHFIQKAILSCDPCHNKSYGVVLICCQNSRIAFCQCGDSGAMSWMYLEGMDAPFHDIMCHENKLYVLANCGSLAVWDLGSDSFPVSTKTITSLFSCASLRQTLNVSSDLYTSRLYLVESSGGVLLVVRRIGEFVDEEGRVLHEGDLLTDKAAEPLVCAYRTLLFGLFRMDFDKETWVSMTSLDDQAVFVGGNHSASVLTCDLPGCEKNSVYFTDDYWERMNEDYLYGGHDMGVYNLKDKSVKHFYQLDALKIQPPPCWFLPNPW
jgi:hypothetical protein